MHDPRWKVLIVMYNLCIIVQMTQPWFVRLSHPTLQPWFGHVTKQWGGSNFSSWCGSGSKTCLARERKRIFFVIFHFFLFLWIRIRNTVTKKTFRQKMRKLFLFYNICLRFTFSALVNVLFSSVNPTPILLMVRCEPCNLPPPRDSNPRPLSSLLHDRLKKIQKNHRGYLLYV